ncbi:MAG: hypothetical protein FJ291_09430 [Planctomycetes bacterium]|nr:hypothetical protein [Planctomycetota bacterium]
MKRLTEKLAALTVAVALALGGYAAYRLWDFTCDDSFITFRYSRNLAHGLGPTFNGEGPPRSEGYTSVLWMLLAAAPELAGADVAVAAKVMGLALSLLCVGACYALAWMLGEDGERGPRALAAALSAALLAAHPFSALHAVSGMETALATFLLTLLVYVGTRRLRGWSRAVPCCALLAGLARPELNLAAAALIAAKLLLVEEPQRRRVLVDVLLFYVVPGAAYFAWRWAYYGAFLPLPFYVKAAGTGTRGLATAIGFGQEVAACFGLLLAAALANLKARCLPAIAALAVTALYLVLPDPLMSHGLRYFHPLVPLIAALAARGTLLVLSAARERLGEGRMVVVHACLVLLGLVAIVPRHEAKERGFLQYARGLREAHIRLGKLLRGHAGGGEAVLAIADAGAVPYYSGWETVDTFGLNDRHIARTGDHSPAYVLARRPTLVVLLSSREDQFNPLLRWERELFDGCLQLGMERVGALRAAPEYYLWLMAHPGSEVARRLRSEL